jgi:putative tryptophan/tyrosine transport system substrate-binding protein
MKRREFITLLGGAAAAWPLAARAQQPAMPVIGYLSSLSPEGNAPRQAAFRAGLNEQGFVEGRNVAVEYRFARGQYERLPAMAEELAGRPVAVIVAVGGEPSPVAAKAATSTIPIVFVMGSDPVKVGLVASYNRPGGNVTGINLFTETLGAKRLGLLHELAPQAAMVGFLNNPRFPTAENQLRDAQEAARALGLTVRILSVSTEQEIDAAFAIIARERIGAVLVGADPFLTAVGRDRIIAAAARATVPAIYEFREQTAAGGLMSYGIDVADVYRQVGVYAGRILKGEKPAELPVLQPTKFELVINLKTAKALGLSIPDKLIALADEVIE